MILRGRHHRGQGLRRGVAVGMAVVAIGATGGFAAGPADPPCRAGNVCVINSAGDVLYQNGGNISGRNIRFGERIWNNGNRQPRADHVTVVARRPDGTRYRMCLHYGPLNLGGADPTAALLGDMAVTDWTWRGECQPDEDQVWEPF
jgi:hypothetical protein